MKCERCQAETDPNTYELFDYCAVCSMNLCPKCMKDGCCKNKPAKSGSAEDHGDDQVDSGED